MCKFLLKLPKGMLSTQKVFVNAQMGIFKYMYNCTSSEVDLDEHKVYNRNNRSINNNSGGLHGFCWFKQQQNYNCRFNLSTACCTESCSSLHERTPKCKD